MSDINQNISRIKTMLYFIGMQSNRKQNEKRNLLQIGIQTHNRLITKQTPYPHDEPRLVEHKILMDNVTPVLNNSNMSINAVRTRDDRKLLRQY